MRVWSGKRVLVVGLGVSGIAAARLLQQLGAHVVGADQKTAAQCGAALSAMQQVSNELRLGSDPQADFAGFDAVVLSPGVAPSTHLLAARREGLAVLSEVELAAPFLAGQILAVTGTNGKSTVTSLLGAMAQASGRPTFVGGNLGLPLSAAVGTSAAAAGGIVVAELSSFQLELTQSLRPQVAVLLNVAPDHLDRYASFDDYAATKGRIFAAQQRGDAAVIADGDMRSAALAGRGLATLHRFGGAGEVRLEQGWLVDTASGWRFDLQRLPPQARFPLNNACAAALAARLAGIEAAAVESGLLGFRGLPHRLQEVGEHAGVRYFDDSKATNVAAAVAAVKALRSPLGGLVLIAGGLPKGDDYAPLVQATRGWLRGLVLLGAAAPAIAACFADEPAVVRQVDSIEAAVATAAVLAEPGDTVLLSPACASLDMFRSYAERGDRFAAAVRQLDRQEAVHA